MKQTIMTLVFFGGLSVQAIAAPFGVSMGMSIKNIDKNAKEVSSSYYVTKKVPKPHSAFDKYIINATPKAGVCVIKAIGKEISASDNGVQLKKEFNEMERKLSNVYRDGYAVDMVMPSSEWKDPKDFMMSLATKERILKAVWSSESSDLGRNLSNIVLSVNTNELNSGHIFVEYVFYNKERCIEELYLQDESAL